MLPTFKTLPQMFAAFPTEQSAIDHLTAIRWANGKFCPLCGCTGRIGTLTGTNTHKCYDCRKRFSIKVGTIFQDSKLDLRTWFAAIWMITNHPKGIASTTLATDLGITQKTAWFVLHRLRHAARTDSFNAPLSGEVEIDETAVGGLERNKHRSKRKKGTGFAGKVVVMGVMQRGGELRAGTISDTRAATIQRVVREHVAPGSTILTDEYRGYYGLRHDYQHRTVNHSTGEYVSPEGYHTNGIESVWALLKRQIIGIHHQVSPKHLDRYVGEMAWRFNRSDVARGDRVNALLAQVEGPLPYKVLIA